MRISVSNFGPVAKATFDIKPITIIIGRNNMGKSFLSQLAYSIICSINKPELKSFGGRYPEADIIAICRFMPQDDGDIKKLARSAAKKEISIERFSEQYIKRLKVLYSNYMAVILADALESSFGVGLKDLINIGAQSTVFSFNIPSLITFTATIDEEGELSVSTAFSKSFHNKINSFIKRNYETLTKSKRKYDKVLDKLSLETANIMKSRWTVANSYFLPAGRGGLLDSWETIAAALFNLTSLAIPRGLNMPALPGTAAKFYDTLYFMKGKKSGAFKKATRLFSELLGGEILMPATREVEKKNIYYKFWCGDFSSQVSIIHAASMVKEIAPLYLIVRELNERNDLLLIEEPESHLHPAAQKKLTDALIELSKENISLVLTTHSDIFLRFFVVEFTRNIKAEKGLGLSNSDLGIYLLRERKKGSVMNKVNISKFGTMQGIPTFDNIINELYDKETHLEIAPPWLG